MHVPVSQEELAQKRKAQHRAYLDEFADARFLKDRFVEQQKRLEKEFPYRPSEDFKGSQSGRRGKQKRGPDFHQSAVARKQLYAQDWVWKGFRIVVRGRKRIPRWMFNNTFLWELISGHTGYSGCRARRCFILYHFYRSGMRARDIAEVLGVSVESIESELERLRGRAETMLDRPEWRWLRDDRPPVIYNAAGKPCGREYIPFSRATKTPEDEAGRDPIAYASCRKGRLPSRGRPDDIALDKWQFERIPVHMPPLNADWTESDLPYADEAPG